MSAVIIPFPAARVVDRPVNAHEAAHLASQMNAAAMALRTDPRRLHSLIFARLGIRGAVELRRSHLGPVIAVLQHLRPSLAAIPSL
ncbi:MAG: hypothetical protein GC201_16390 [Alphaproteobacteria bacterium]|nr:hypothetical protein [Alphaproteobacteria bacterium]